MASIHLECPRDSSTMLYPIYIGAPKLQPDSCQYPAAGNILRSWIKKTTKFVFNCSKHSKHFLYFQKNATKKLNKAINRGQHGILRLKELPVMSRMLHYCCLASSHTLIVAGGLTGIFCSIPWCLHMLHATASCNCSVQLLRIVINY